MRIAPSHFRLSDHWTEDGRVIVEVEKFYTVKETPCGYWVVSEYYWRLKDTFPEWVEKHKRWTSKLGGRYLHASLELAKQHYSLRKQHEVRHIQARLDKCRQIQGCWDLLTIEALARDGEIDLGMPGSRAFKLNAPEPSA